VIALLVVVAFFAGLVDAIAGGGGLLTVPALLSAGLPPHLALGTNKGQSVFGSASAVVAFARRGALDKRRAWITFPLGLFGSFAGAAAVLAVPPAMLRPVVLVLLPVAAIMLVVRKPDRAGAPKPSTRQRMLASAALALVVGAYDGFFGPGTGTFLIVGFVILLHEPMVAATADAKVVNFASNLAAVALFTMRGQILWRVSLPMAAAQLTGAWVGAHLAVRGGEKVIRRMVVAVVIGLCGKLVYDLIA
jgi:uncharacterized membrane protein YfcA